jgi:DivIVA domain-containing protein
MSTSTEHTVPNSTEEVPQFATVMRGYDRGQVDDYVARLIDFLADAERRAERAEAELIKSNRRAERLAEELRQALDRLQQPAPQQPWQGLGERLESMLRLAQEEADAIRDRGRTEAEELLETARRQREQEVQGAERDLAAVASRRDAVVAELRKVQDVLATLGLRKAVENIEQTTDVSPVAGADRSSSDPERGGGPDADDDSAATRVIRLPDAVNR